MYVCVCEFNVSYSLLQSLWSAGNISVCAVHMTTDGVVLAALGDGRIMIFNTALKTRSFIEPDKNCSSCNRTLSEIAAIHSLSSLGLLAIGFTCGQIQVCSYQETIQDSLDVHCCIHLAAGLSLHSLLCISSPSTGASSSDRSDLSVWCGTSSSSVVICELSLTAGQPWGAREHSQNVTSVSVCEEHASTAVFTAKELKLSTDMGTVVALLHQPRSQVSSLALIDTATKTLLLYVTCDKMSGECNMHTAAVKITLYEVYKYVPLRLIRLSHDNTSPLHTCVYIHAHT